MNINFEGKRILVTGAGQGMLYTFAQLNFKMLFKFYLQNVS